jgi:hypothetical protein
MDNVRKIKITVSINKFANDHFREESAENIVQCPINETGSSYPFERECSMYWIFQGSEINFKILWRGSWKCSLI